MEKKAVNGYTHPWTEKEKYFIEKNYKKTSIDNISKKIDRTVPAIKAKLNAMGLIKENKKNYEWTDILNEVFESLKV